jgi:hypothetical protein
MTVLYAGALGDRYGRVRLLCIGLIGLLIAGTAASLAPTIEFLMGARAHRHRGGLRVSDDPRPHHRPLGRGAGARPRDRPVDGDRRRGHGRRFGDLGCARRRIRLAHRPAAARAGRRRGPPHRRAGDPRGVEESVEPVDHLGGILSVVAVAALVLGLGVVFAPGRRARGRACSSRRRC